MAQANINIRIDADLKRDFERLCRDVGMNMTTAFNVFMKQSVRENKISVALNGDPAHKTVVTVDELRKGIQELDAGFGVPVSLEELEAMEREPAHGPTYQKLERRRAEIAEKKRIWEEKEAARP